MAKEIVTPAWQVFTDGTNSAIASPEGRLMLYIGDTAPAATEPGMPFKDEKVQVSAPAQSWIKSGDGAGGNTTAIIFTY